MICIGTSYEHTVESVPWFILRIDLEKMLYRAFIIFYLEYNAFLANYLDFMDVSLNSNYPLVMNIAGICQASWRMSTKTKRNTKEINIKVRIVFFGSIIMFTVKQISSLFNNLFLVCFVAF